jgi:hypothetical protein
MVLLNDRARSGHGTDLMHYEVKLAIVRNSFEYQYHKSHGLEKLEADKSVDHIFIAYSPSYTDVEVWQVEGSKLIPSFNRWLPQLRKNYENPQKQRFRRSVTYNFVISQGICMLTIKNGKIIADE